jgi:hypothetical protein
VRRNTGTESPYDPHVLLAQGPRLAPNPETAEQLHARLTTEEKVGFGLVGGGGLIALLKAVGVIGLTAWWGGGAVAAALLVGGVGKFVRWLSEPASGEPR